MTKGELLVELRIVETKLRSAEVQTFYRNQPQGTRDRFVWLRNEISLAINRLSNTEIAEIAAKLNELSDDLEVGTTDLKKKIEDMDDAVAILNTTATVFGLVARVLALVV